MEAGWKGDVLRVQRLRSQRWIPHPQVLRSDRRSRIPNRLSTTKVAPVLGSRLPCTSAVGRILFHSLRGFVWYRIDLWEEGHDRCVSQLLIFSRLR